MENITGTDGCFVCGKPEGKNTRSLGIEFFWNAEIRKVVALIRPDPTWCGYKNIVHGGIIAAVVDDAMGKAVFRETSKMGFTGTLSMKYRKNMTSCRQYTVNAFTTEIRGKRIKAKAVINDEDGNICSEAEALFIIM